MHLPNRWKAALFIFALLVTSPILVLLSAWLSPDIEIWQHFAETILLDLVINTVLLVVGVGIGVTLLGAGMAWLVVMCEFPGRRFFEWLLFLPFAVPAYVLAFVFLGLFDFAGSLQSWLRAYTPFVGVDIRQGSLGVIVIFSLVFYPYVYMLARVAFLSQSISMLEAGRVLGLTPFGILWRLSLPMARPAIAAGLALALMETLADFGTVSVFNYDTFTTAIYAAWEDFRSLQTAAQMSTLLMLVALLLLALERWGRGSARFDSVQCLNVRPFQLHGLKAWSVTAVLSLVIFIAFLLPLMQLIIWSWSVVSEEWDVRYWLWLKNTLVLGISAAIIVVGGSLLLNMIRRHVTRSKTVEVSIRLTTLGYALPGSVLAVGVMLLFVGVDHGLRYIYPDLSFYMSSGLAALMMAYFTRFLAVAHGPVESGFDTITPSITEAARGLGAGRRKLLSRVYLPLLRPGLITALFMVAVDVMKELPATYLLRPYGWDTLAVRTYELTAEGLYERAAVPALLLVLLSLSLLVFLNYKKAASHA
jgi:iron(III) transport system permease protein